MMLVIATLLGIVVGQEGDGCEQFDTLSYECAPFKKGSATADPACDHGACAYMTCKKICNQTFIDANPSSPISAPAGCSAYANDAGTNYEYRCFPSVPILPDEHWQGGHGSNSNKEHTPPTVKSTPLIVVGSLLFLAAIYPCAKIAKRCSAQAGKGNFRQLSSYETGETLNETFVDDLSDYEDYDENEDEEDVFRVDENNLDGEREVGGTDERARMPAPPSHQPLSDSSTEA